MVIIWNGGNVNVLSIIIDVNTQTEKYFFSLFLMFKPWRKIQDLKNGYDTYAESFHNDKLHLEEALKFDEKLEELKNAFETAK